MKLTTLVLLSLLFALAPTTASGQSEGSVSTPSRTHFEVVKFSWGTYRAIGDFSIYVKNTGTVAIVAVEWGVVLTDTVRRNAVYDRLSFRHEKAIAPGKKVRLQKRFDYHVTPSNVQASPVLTKVEYADGTVWRRQSAS